MTDTPRLDAWRRRYDDAIIQSILRWADAPPVPGDGLVVAFDAAWVAWCMAQLAEHADVRGVTVRGTTATFTRPGQPRFRVVVRVEPAVVDTFRVACWWRTPDAALADEVVVALRNRGAMAVLVSTKPSDAVDAISYAAGSMLDAALRRERSGGAR